MTSINKSTCRWLKSLIFFEYGNENRVLAMVSTFCIWWFCSWAGNNFDPSMSVYSLLLIIAWICLVIPIFFIIEFWPANILVNFGILTYIHHHEAISWFWIYSILYWILFIFLHYKILRGGKVIYSVFLAVLLFLTAYGCRDHTKGLFG
jgi:hypothetical protein